MKIGSFLAIAAALHGLLGVAALIAPNATAGTFGISIDAGGVAIVRLLGSTLVGVAAVFWWTRNLDPAQMLQGALVGGLVVNLLSFLVVALAASGGDMGSRGWIGAGLRLLLAAGFGYFAFLKPPSVASRANER